MLMTLSFYHPAGVLVNICEEFGLENNLKFSTDKDPAKSKTKCMVGPTVKNPVHPAPVKLYGTDLPWVTHATHLGHELNQDCTMNMDTRMKSAAFIKNSVDTLCSVLPCLHRFSMPSWYTLLTSMDLHGEMANQVYKSWNTCVKLV